MYIELQPQDVVGGVLARRRRERALQPGACTRSLLQLNLRTFGNTSLTLELNLSTIGTHSRVNLGYMGDNVSFS